MEKIKIDKIYVKFSLSVTNISAMLKTSEQDKSLHLVQALLIYLFIFTRTLTVLLYFLSGKYTYICSKLCLQNVYQA